MSPQVEAAWIALIGVVIGISGTAFVAWLGFRNTRAATEKTVRAARSDRLWDRKADAYKDVMAETLKQLDRLRFLAKSLQRGKDYDQAAESPGMQLPQEWGDTEGRISTFGAQEVMKAYGESIQATRIAHERLTDLRQAALRVVEAQQASASELEAAVDAWEAAIAAGLDALKDAIAVDQALMQAIRDDLDKESDGTAPSPR
jgi:hypothetical protein